MNRILTKQEQLFACLVVTLVLTGMAVKAWRAAHPQPPAAMQQVNK